MAQGPALLLWVHSADAGPRPVADTALLMRAAVGRQSVFGLRSSSDDLLGLRGAVGANAMDVGQEATDPCLRAVSGALGEAEGGRHGISRRLG